MIERKFVLQKIKEHEIEEYISDSLSNVGHSHTKMVKTPLGEKITIYASRPGLIVGRRGQNIKQLTKNLKKKFNLENPQIEINEVENLSLDANIVAERIVDFLERFGSQRFKSIGHKMMGEVMGSGALGIEIIISGKVPSSRAKSWRFYSGYLKKCGDISITGVDTADVQAKLKKGVVGVKIKIMPPTTKLPDNIELIEEKEEIVEEVKEGEEEVEAKEDIKKSDKKEAEGEEEVKKKEAKKKAKEEKVKTEKPKEKEGKDKKAEEKEEEKKRKRNEE